MATAELYNLAQHIIERAEALGLKGKKGDDMALDYIIGAAVGARIAGNEKIAGHFACVAAMIISVRGYSEFERIVAEHNKPSSKAA